MKEFLQVFVSESLEEFQEAFLEESPADFGGTEWTHVEIPGESLEGYLVKS